jgi:hypothetical protein
VRIVENLSARGHPDIGASHPSTLEITKDAGVTKRGDCIVAVQATKGLTNLSGRFRRASMNDSARIIIELRTAGITERIHGRGSHLLSLTDPEEMVVRKSNFVSDRTLAIGADKAARDIDRRLVRAMKSPSASIQIRLIVEI